MEVRERTGDPQGGPERVEGPTEKCRTGRGNHLEVQNPRKVPGLVVQTSCKSGTVWGPSGRFEMGLGTLGEVQDESGALQGGPGQIRGPSEAVQNGSGDPRGGVGRVGGPSKRSGTCWWTLGEVRDGSGDPRGGLERVGGPSGRSGTGREILGEVRDGSRDPWGGLERVYGPSGKSRTGQWTLGEVRDVTEDPWGGPGRV